MKIVLFSLKYDRNLGDCIISESTYNALKEIQECEIVELDVSGRNSTNSLYPITFNFFEKCRWAFFNTFSKKVGPALRIKMENYMWQFTREAKVYRKYYEDVVKSSDVIVIAGGGMIKFKFQWCYQYVSKIVEMCEKYNKPVILNAVGIEGYDESDPRCMRLKRVLNSSVVKQITTRDDIDLLKNSYITNPNIHLERVCDSAVLSSQFYGIQKQNSNIIGIGVIRPDIFVDHGIQFYEEDLMNFYGELINELKKRNIDFELFTNGAIRDQEFGQKVCERFNVTIVQRPETSKQLVEIVSRYSTIFASRLHACIISYSLDIPCLALVWNHKLTMFGEIIHCPERFFEVNSLEITKIVDTLEQAKSVGYDQKLRKEYMYSGYNSLKAYFESEVFIHG